MAWPLVITPQAVRGQLGERGTEAYLSRLVPRDSPDPAQAKLDALIEAIQDAQAVVETNTGTFLTQRIIKSYPVSSDLVIGQDYDIEDDAYDFWREDWESHAKITLRYRPVQSVQRVALRYGQSDPLTIATFPDQWINIAKRTGTLNIVPLFHSAMMQNAALFSLWVSGAGGARNDAIPLAVTVDYTAGHLPRNFDASATGTAGDRVAQSRSYEIRTLALAVQLRAAALVLSKYELAIAPGGGSVSVEGSSQSFQGPRFDPQIRRFNDEAQVLENSWLALNGGPAMTVF